MESVLAEFFCEHQHQEEWWHKMKTTVKVAGHSTNDTLLLPDKTPDQQCCILKLLGIMLLQLWWEVLAKCKLTKKKDQFHMIIKHRLKEFMQTKGLVGFLMLGRETSNEVFVMLLGISFTK
jgi:hypothetical protein